MRGARVVAPVLLAVVLASLAATRPHNPERASGEAEVRRIRAHFDSVLAELDAPNADRSLRPVQRRRRAALLTTLGDYRDRGIFPHNYDFPGQAVPYFVDRETGTLCAVAHLLAATGRRDIVDRVARTNNNVRVMQLAGDTAFAAWLGTNGLTLGEAARIQVPYLIDDAPPRLERTGNAFLQIASPVSAGASLLSSVLMLRGNADGHSRATNVIGAVSGLTTTVLGLVSLNRPGVPIAASAAGIAVGGLGIALSTRSINRHEALTRKARAIEPASLAPFVSPSGGAGVSVSLSF